MRSVLPALLTESKREHSIASEGDGLGVPLTPVHGNRWCVHNIDIGRRAVTRTGGLKGQEQEKRLQDEVPIHGAVLARNFKDRQIAMN